MNQTNLSDTLEIYTDGACRGNPGIGGWGAWLLYKQAQKECFGAEADTTNNRMELTAVIEALKCLKRPCQITLYTDSQYVKKGITEWLANWKNRQWKTASRQPVKNIDLWQQIDTLSQKHTIDWQWVKGHAGNAGNEKADQLANHAIDKWIQQHKS